MPTFSEAERLKAVQFIQKVRWTQENEPIRFFQPHGGQEGFILELDPDTLVAISGAGNGWGKSEVLAAILAAAMWPALAPAPLKVPLLQEWRYPKRARIYSTPAELAAIGSLQTAIAKWFPKGRYKASNGDYGYPSVFAADTGWVLDMFSYERPAKEAAGPNIGLQIFNEPPPFPLWKEAALRARNGGIILGGMTSLDDNPWIVADVFDKADGKTIKVRYGNSCENCKQHGKNGNLEHAHIMRALDQILDADEREARFTGKPLSISGRIFRTFDRGVHVLPEFKLTAEHAVYQVVDPAGGKPLAVIYAAIDSAGFLTVFDEWPNFPFHGAKDPGLSPSQYADLFKEKESAFPRGVQTRIMDRRYGNMRHKPGATTLREDFSALGFDYQDSYSVGPDEPEVHTGIMSVFEWLKYDKSKPVDALNCPRLRITQNCANTIKSVVGWSRDPKTLKPKDDSNKDFCDDIRYLVKASPEVETVSTWKQPKAHFGVNNAG